MTRLSDSQHHNRTNTDSSCCDNATHDASCSSCRKLFTVEPLALALGVPICKDDITNATFPHIHPVTANRYVHSTLVYRLCTNQHLFYHCKNVQPTVVIVEDQNIVKYVLIEIENAYTAELTNMLERDL